MTSGKKTATVTVNLFSWEDYVRKPASSATEAARITSRLITVNRKQGKETATDLMKHGGNPVDCPVAVIPVSGSQ